MNPDPFISVCIPAYMRTEFLKRLLDSLLIQTYPHFEIVLTDDSPDDSVRHLVQSHALSAKILYFKNPMPLGTPENWNEGLRRAGGTWIKIMHDDDWFSGPDSLARFAEAAVNSGASFYFSAYNNVLPDGTKELPFRAGNFARALDRAPEILLASNRIGPPSVVLFRAEKGIEFDRRMKWLVDIDFYIRYLKLHPSAVYLPDLLVNIGISASQVTQSSFGNPAVEIPERMLLAEKLGYGSLKNWMVYDSWWRFLRNMHVRSADQLQSEASAPVHPVLRSMIRWQNRLPRKFLKNGVSSKIIMSMKFVAEKMRKT